LKADPRELGRVVQSTQGHDRGRWFLVVGLVDERFVLIADGETRKLEKPKKKQVKHLLTVPAIAEDTLKQIRDGSQNADSAIRKALKTLVPKMQNGSTGAARKTDKEECALVQE
jgi:ribosomal protein L14E/L6E/L27E